MSSIKANITNIYQVGENRIVRTRTWSENEGEKVFPAQGSEAGKTNSVSEQGQSSAGKQNHAAAKDPETQLGLPTDPNGLAQRVMYTGDKERQSEGTRQSPELPSRAGDRANEAKRAYQEEQGVESELRESRRGEVLRQDDLAKERAAKARTAESNAAAAQPKSLSVLEQFMLRLRDQALSRGSDQDQGLVNQANEERLLAADRSAQRNGELGAEDVEREARQSAEQRQDDREMHSIRRHIHTDLMNNIQSRAAGNHQAAESAANDSAPVPVDNQLPAEQKPIAQRPVYEAIDQPYPIDLEDYVKQLALALIPEIPPEPVEADVTAGTKMLDHLQREGVFGLSPQGRYQSVNDFVRTKGFEFELEQRPFTQDEFLLETETAIYNVLSRGNTSSVAKSLLQAAEAVNSFRNHMIRASGDDLSAAPAEYASSPPAIASSSVSAYDRQK